MPHVLKSRVAEVSTTTGTGAFTLAGALTGHQAFSAVCATSDTTEYVIVAVDGSGVPTGAWEEGIGTYSSANTLTRTTVVSSSNSNAAVNFSAGSKVVLLTPVAQRVAGSLDTKLALPANDFDLRAASYFTKTFSAGAVTLTASNIPPSGLVGSFILDATNMGLATITWGTGFTSAPKWPSGTTPALSTAGRDKVAFITSDAGATWDALLLGRAIA